MIDPVLMSLVQMIQKASDAVVLYLEQQEMEDQDYVCPCPESEIEVAAGSTMGESHRICKLCGKKHPIDPDEGGDLE